ncbi:MAG: hypothetical protein ACKOTE_10980 [Opitutaceae bacterium]
MTLVPSRQHRRSLRRPVTFLVICAAGAGVATRAQTAPPAREEPVILSPFVTDASSESGYLATSSLAGTRLKTDFRDIASQVSVMTP